MAEKPCKKSSKFVTGIVIGGAIGSLASWAFGSKRRREKLAEKAQEYYEKGSETIRERLDQMLEEHEKEKAKGWLSRLFKKK
ncbi:MAG: hypothetical protein Q8P95_02210 [bacterium]|nr:hypothetical protein [bacterium]